MSETLTLTYVNRQERMSKENKPYTSVSIMTKEYGKMYLSGFGSSANEGWKVGDAVEVEAVEEKKVGDKTYLNFKMPSKARAGAVDTKKIEFLLEKISNQIAILVTYFGNTKTPAAVTPKIDRGYNYPEPGEPGVPIDEPNFDEFGDPK